MTSTTPVSDRPTAGTRLVDAALTLLERDGVLAGLNLREVADLAGVNRANIYHHFGSRRELLRAAIVQGFTDVATPFLSRIRDLPFIARKLSVLTSRDAHSDSLLRALLAIDGDEDVEPMPNLEQSISDLRRDIIDGHLDASHDLEAFQVVFNALTRGYEIFRTSYARQLGITPEELDERAAPVVETWLASMAPRATEH